jgi:hypothetical protein
MTRNGGMDDLWSRWWAQGAMAVTPGCCAA